MPAAVHVRVCVRHDWKEKSGRQLHDALRWRTRRHGSGSAAEGIASDARMSTGVAAASRS